MTPESPKQFDMFSGELVDARTRQQKRRDREQQQPQPVGMFSQREVAQFGVKARPQFAVTTKTKLELMIEDRRTPEEKERDALREAEAHAWGIFDESPQCSPSLC